MDVNVALYMSSAKFQTPGSHFQIRVSADLELNVLDIGFDTLACCGPPFKATTAFNMEFNIYFIVVRWFL